MQRFLVKKPTDATATTGFASGSSLSVVLVGVVEVSAPSTSGGWVISPPPPSPPPALVVKDNSDPIAS